jgi:hypothetical protein
VLKGGICIANIFSNPQLVVFFMKPKTNSPPLYCDCGGDADILMDLHNFSPPEYERMIFWYAVCLVSMPVRMGVYLASTWLVTDSTHVLYLRAYPL